MKRECDFVAAKLNEVIGLYQVCLEINNENEKREIEGLTEALEFFKLRKGVIITLNQEDELKIAGKNISIIPAWKWLS
jgi:predicted AAA+ superfamily ATPase